MKGMIKDALILFAITLIAGLMLGVVNDITKEPIAQQEQKAKNEACQNVFAAADSFEAQELADSAQIEQVLTDAGISGADIDELMAAKDASGALLGYVITVQTTKVMVEIFNFPWALPMRERSTVSLF